MAAASAADETSYGLSEPETLLSFLADADIRVVRLEYLIELLGFVKGLDLSNHSNETITFLL